MRIASGSPVSMRWFAFALAFALALALKPGALRAQDSAGARQAGQGRGPDVWSGEVHFTMEPSLGASVADSRTSSAPLTDDTAYELGASATYTGLAGVPVKLGLRGIYNPDQFEQEPTSSLRGDLVVGRTRPSSTGLVVWGEVNLSHVWDRCLVHYDDDEEAAAAGACEETEAGFFTGDPRWDTNLRAGAAWVPGPLFEVQLTLDQTFSSDPSEARIVPRLAATLHSPWNFAGIRPGLLVAFDQREYHKRRVASGEKRSDSNLTIGPLLNFDAFFHIGASDSVALALLYQKRWSNLEGEPYSRFYFVPQISLRRSF